MTARSVRSAAALLDFVQTGNRVDLHVQLRGDLRQIRSAVERRLGNFSDEAGEQVRRHSRQHIERRERFIHQQQTRMYDQRARETHPLAHAAGELAGPAGGSNITAVTKLLAARNRRETRFGESGDERNPGSLPSNAPVRAGAAPEDQVLSIKYYTHFLLTARASSSLSEFCGVIELNRTCSRGDCKEPTSLLAKNLECKCKDIKLLDWSRLQ
jgi:hypothetical protein